MGEIGYIAVGAAKAEPVEERAWSAYLTWLAEKKNAGMGYMANHQAIRRDPRLLLEGAQTVVSFAFSFAPPYFRDPSLPMIACYAYGDDYHDVIRNRLSILTEEWEHNFGGNYRICIDSAPIAERYWAVKCGIGNVGENGSVIVPGHGSMVFLAEIITTLPLEKVQTLISLNEGVKNRGEDKNQCNHCRACRKVCPGQAIWKNGEVDARRCLSYLTIEHRGDFTDNTALEVMATEAGKNTLFGCDLCLRACPLNSNLRPTEIAEFAPRKEIMSITRDDIAGMTTENFSKIFKKSAIKRSKLHGLKRNLKIADSGE